MDNKSQKYASDKSLDRWSGLLIFFLLWSHLKNLGNFSPSLWSQWIVDRRTWHFHCNYISSRVVSIVFTKFRDFLKDIGTILLSQDCRATLVTDWQMIFDGNRHLPVNLPWTYAKATTQIGHKGNGCWKLLLYFLLPLLFRFPMTEMEDWNNKLND